MFDKIIVMCNIFDIGELIGFLFGMEEEKMMLWFVFVIDILEVLYKNDYCIDGLFKYICDKVNI